MPFQIFFLSLFLRRIIRLAAKADMDKVAVLLISFVGLDVPGVGIRFTARRHEGNFEHDPIVAIEVYGELDWIIIMGRIEPYLHPARVDSEDVIAVSVCRSQVRALHYEPNSP